MAYMSKTPPPFSTRADELTAGDFIVASAPVPVQRPVIARVLTVDVAGDDAVIETTAGEFTTSIGNLITCLGRVLELR